MVKSLQAYEEKQVFEVRILETQSENRLGRVQRAKPTILPLG
jgi:hypothetical protein